MKLTQDFKTPDICLLHNWYMFDIIWDPIVF